jgi:DNA-directed RNA polymerase subunit M/transcription elongation factor TFIIS
MESNWKPTKSENPDFTCRKCTSDNVWYYVWESSCGGYEDYKYHCRSCNSRWVAEGSDA